MTSCLNARVIDELRLIMGEDIGILFEMYLSDSEIKLNQLASSLENGDNDVIRRIAHSLRGSSKNIGADSVAGYCASLEVAARDGLSDNWAALFGEIIKSFRLTKVEINRDILPRG